MKDRRPGAGPVVNRPLFRAPAVQALLIQFLSFSLVLVLASVEFPPLSIAGAAFLQGTIAVILSRLRGFAWWWLPIQFLFAPALMLFHALALPSWVFLGAFLFMLPLYWTTFRTQVPFFPSGPAAWHAVLEVLPHSRPLRCVDLGSGFGGFALHLAAARPDCSVIGIELAPLPWLLSALRARASGSRARFLRGDYDRLDFSVFDVVFAYLSPAAMPALWQKACAEMPQGALLLSYEFSVPDVEPDVIVEAVNGGPSLYGWYIGKPLSPSSSAF